ncbi:MFS transporter [Spirosoma jeollabukense]
MLQRTFHLYQRAYQGLSPSVWLLAGVMLINRCGTMVLPYMTLYLTQKLHYSITNAGIVMAIYGLGAFVGTFLGGRLTDRIGFYYVQLVSLLFSGAALLTLQFITSFPLLCGSVFVFTLFGDAFRPANQTAIAYYSETENRTRAFSLNRLAINLGWSVGGGLGGLLASINYNLLFWADGLTCLTAGLVLWLYLPVPKVPGHNPTTAPIRSNQPDSTTSGQSILTRQKLTSATPYRDTLFLTLVFCNTLYMLAFMQFFTMAPLYFKEKLDVPEQAIGLLLALNGLLIVFIEMALVYKLESQKRQKVHLITAGVLLEAVAYSVLALPGLVSLAVPGMSIALSFILIVTFSEMLVMPFLQSLIVERSKPATRGQYLAVYAMGGALAQTASPALGSQLVAHFGFSTHWLVVVGISLASAGGFWLLGRRLKTQLFREA